MDVTRYSETSHRLLINKSFGELIGLQPSLLPTRTRLSQVSQPVQTWIYCVISVKKYILEEN